MALFIADAVISIFIIKIQILRILMVILLWMITINGQFYFFFKLEIAIMYSMLYNNKIIIDI